MIVEIDFSTGAIIRSSNLEVPDFVTRFPAPIDYSPLSYNYIPFQIGVYDPNGFVPIQPIAVVNPEKRQQNINRMNMFMSDLVGNGITQANFDLFLSDTSSLTLQYLGGGSRLITWIESVNRNGYNATTNGFKTRTAYRGATTNGVNGIGGDYPRANTILSFLNDL